MTAAEAPDESSPARKERLRNDEIGKEEEEPKD